LANKKNFVLDTNVLLHDAQSIFKFQDNLVVIPLIVIEELDTFKKGEGEIARNSRQVSRYLDELRVKGDISVGIPLDNGGTLKVDISGSNEGVHEFLKGETPDNKILSVAYKAKIKNEKVIFRIYPVSMCFIIIMQIRQRIRK